MVSYHISSNPFTIFSHSRVNPCGSLYSVTCVNWCQSCTAHGRLLDTRWLCYMYAGRLYPLLGSNKSEWSAHRHVVCVIFLSGRHEREDHGLHLPTVFRIQLLVGATEAWRGFLWTSWHQPRPTKQDGWRILESMVYMKSVLKKKIGTKKERIKPGLLLSVRTLGCSHGIVCCLVISLQASGQGLLPRRSQSLYMYRPLRTTSGGQWAHFVFQSNWGYLDVGHSCSKQQRVKSSLLEKQKLGISLSTNTWVKGRTGHKRTSASISFHQDYLSPELSKLHFIPLLYEGFFVSWRGKQCAEALRKI